MGTSDNADTPSFAQQVNNIVSQATVDDKGNFQLPDGVEADEGVLYAAKLEKQKRDTQSAFTKSQQEAKRLKAENDKLAQSWEQDAVSKLSSDEQARLEELKVQDPDTWRSEITKLEEDKKTAFSEKRSAISKEASQMTELELREAQLEEFNQANPDIQITDDLIENDIPPRLTKKLENGDISFADFLVQCKDYVAKPKKIASKAAEDGPDFNAAPGGQSPSKEAIEAQSSSDYNSEIF